MIKFNEVTWYSKLATAIFVLIVFPLMMFRVGMEYQKVLELNEGTQIIQKTKTHNPKTNIDSEPSIKSDISTSTNQKPMPPVVGAKINPRVACESALAYTTFTDGAASEKFVNECVEGKHPEVIQRYISDMGWDGRTI
jgi:hypothetical protein